MILSLLPTRKWRVLILAVVGFCLSGPRATAGCGPDHGLETMLRLFSSTDPTGALSPTGGTPRRQCPQNTPGEQPCQGPFCSGNPPTDAVPLSSRSAEQTQDQWSVLLAPAQAPDQCAEPLFLSSAPLPLRRTVSIFHPPRHS